jgi:hypothetical protein
MMFSLLRSSKQNHCSKGETIPLAALAPERATAGTPIPGKMPSPVVNYEMQIYRSEDGK